MMTAVMDTAGRQQSPAAHSLCSGGKMGAPGERACSHLYASVYTYNNVRWAGSRSCIRSVRRTGTCLT
jgi:hypothetical protein